MSAELMRSPLGRVAIRADGLSPITAQSLLLAVESLCLLEVGAAGQVSPARLRQAAADMTTQSSASREILITMLTLIAEEVEQQQLLAAAPEHTFRPYTPPSREASDETALALSLATHLRERGERPALQVACAVGVADVVTAEAVYEVKSWLTRTNFMSALGQVLLYRQAINPALRAVIVGFEVPNVPLGTLVAYAQQLGVEVLICNSR